MLDILRRKNGKIYLPLHCILRKEHVCNAGNSEIFLKYLDKLIWITLKNIFPRGENLNHENHEFIDA